MPPKRNLASAFNAPAMNQAAIRQLVVDSVVAALEAQASNMANADNTNRNPKPREAPVARKSKLTHAVNQQTSAVTTAMTAILKQFQATPPLAFVKSVEEICITCGSNHPYYQCLAADGNIFLKFRDNIQGCVSVAVVNYNQGPLPSNTIANPKGELKAITTQSGLVLDGPSVYMPHPFINPEENELVILKKLPKKLGDPGKFLISYGFSELKCKALANLVGKFTFPADFVIVDYESDPRVPLILRRPFLRTARALIEVHGEEMILHDGDERLTLNMRHDTSSYSNQPHKESINMINIDNDSYEDYLEDFGNTTSFSPDHLLEEFADELALITFPLENDDLPFDIESNLREIEYLLNHDPTKEMDSILEDSIDKCNLADPNNDLVDIIPKMFTDEHTLDYSSPPLYDDVDDDLVKLDSDNDDVYNDPFDSKEDKIKEFKLLIDELNPPRSSDFLLSPEYDSVLYEDFSEVDALPSTNNEDKVYNSGILIHENLFEVTIQVAPNKNVKKISISNASLILEDFNPPLYELPFHKEVPGSETLLSFSSKNKEKISTSRFLLLKEFILLFSQNYLIGAPKLSKSLKILKARWRFFIALMERTSVFWMFRVSISILHEQLNSGIESS
uniref:Reverse transcriptase domain-containing protein n=1 Tax=Tanacetum cinerariifolium TaxID=118510 RepID=A0A699GUY9_TANCI|nr:hypothetical protein [Tanacetum cinerariifolium]